ncbi:MAG: PQQ-dependent sugar dehydrogenase [Verrucomicrobiota bacterium]
MHRLITSLILIGAFVSCSSTGQAAPLDSNFTESVVINDAANLGGATDLLWAPDGSNRLFITRKDGQIRILKNGVLNATPFATVSPLYNSSECGLNGICFDPNFVVNHYVYVFVTVSASEQQIIRYTDSNDIGTAKTVIVPGLPTVGQNHDGGAIGIGPDGKLYWSIGDNGNGTGVNADLTSLASKVGRANLDGSVPNDNPFFDGGGPNNDYIWARGFRNPFKFTFQPGTGQLWVNITGENYEQVMVVNRGDHAGWNTYENNQPAGYIAPVIVYRTNGTDTRTIASGGAVRNNNIVTFTTESNHGFRKGNKITISGVTAGSFNGSFYLASVPSPTTFTVSQAGPNETSGTGSAVTLNQGGAITGGTFYDSTAFPAAYRGNYFHGDYNSGRIQRATLDANNEVSSDDFFVTGVTSYVDATTGPDGALYYVSVGSGILSKLAYNGTEQNLIVTPTAFNMIEGGTAVFTVRLAQAPASNVTVTVAKTAGDPNVTVTGGAQLTFTPANYATLQSVTLTATTDADLANSTATISVSSPGLPTYDVVVNAIDTATPSLVLSTTTLTINEASSGTFTVNLASVPGADVAVTVARSAGDADISVASGAALTFTPANYATPQTVTIAAAADVDTVTDTATISVSAAGATTRTVSVTALDNNQLAPAITSLPVTTAVAGAAYSYDVSATGNPAPTYSLSTFPSGMSINATTGLITWTPAATGNFSVTVQAANGVLPNSTQSFTLKVNADQPPTTSLTKPTEGATVSGANSEFFGDGHDDVGTVKAEFYVDNILGYTDVNTAGHYHFGGEHLMWDTTLYSNGPHVVKMMVYDTKGQTSFQTRNVTVANASTITISTSASPVAGGSTSGGGSFLSGTTVTVTAIANGGYSFADWSEGGIPVSPAASYTFTANANRTLVATFNSTNATIQITTPPTVTNALMRVGNTAAVIAGNTNVFDVGAVNSIARPLSYTWMFGDGVGSARSSASTTTYVYPPICGPYTANVVVDDGLTSNTTAFTVSVVCELEITKLNAKVNFAKTNADSCSFKGTVHLPADYSFAGKTVTISLGGAQVSFLLDDKGRGEVDNNRCQLDYIKNTGHWEVSVKLKNGSWAEPWAAIGMSDQTISKPGAAITMTVVLLVDRESFAGEQPLTYTAKQGKSGSAK